MEIQTRIVALVCCTLIALVSLYYQYDELTGMMALFIGLLLGYDEIKKPAMYFFRRKK